MAESYTLQYDEQGRPYYQLPGQPRRYVSPVAMGGQAPEDTTGMFRSRPQWNPETGEWETPIDWGNVLNAGIGGALGGNLAHAAMSGAGGQSAASAGGTLPHAPAANASLAMSPSAVPGAATAAGVSAGVPIAAGAAGGGAGLARELLGMKDYAALIPAGIGAFLGSREPAANKDLERILGLAEGRITATEPLFQALNAMAQAQMPAYTRGGK